MLLIVDIDGSIACIKDRMEKYGHLPDRTNMEEYQKQVDRCQQPEALAADPPISEVVTLLVAAKFMSHDVVFLTGRSNKYRHVTEAWLKRWCIKHFGPLYMRDEDDWRPPGEFKKEVILRLLQERNPDIVIALDDDPSGCTAPVYSELGIRHLKVMPKSADRPFNRQVKP